MAFSAASNAVMRPILLVEDNPMDLDLTCRAFAGRTRNPIEIARDGEEALSWLKRWEEGAPQPLVVLLDLKLPRVGGLEVLQQIKSHRLFGAIPVVVLSSSSEDGDVHAAYRLGANSYIVKPVDFEVFTSVAEEIDRYWCGVNEPPREWYPEPG